MVAVEVAGPIHISQSKTRVTVLQTVVKNRWCTNSQRFYPRPGAVRVTAWSIVLALHVALHALALA